MITSSFGPDGRWVGQPEPVALDATVPTPQPVLSEQQSRTLWRFLRTGCLGLVALALLPVAAFAALFSLVSAFDEGATTTVATVREVSPGEGADGGWERYCYTVEYVADGLRTHRSCDVFTAPRATSPPSARRTVLETEAEQEARFAAEHPPGSTVLLTYENDDVDRVRGPLAEVGTHRSTGSTRSAVLSGAIAVALLLAAGFALRGAFVRRRG